MILIKDMGMPYSCDRCRLRNIEHSECCVAWKRVGIYGVDYTTGRPAWCPLTEVEPYGIDGLLYKEK